MTNKARIILVILIIIVPGILIAQPVFEPQVYDVPFDDWIGIPIAIVICYGLFKIKEQRRKDKTKRVLNVQQ